MKILLILTLTLITQAHAQQNLPIQTPCFITTKSILPATIVDGLQFRSGLFADSMHRTPYTGDPVVDAETHARSKTSCDSQTTELRQSLNDKYTRLGFNPAHIVASSRFGYAERVNCDGRLLSRYPLCVVDIQLKSDLVFSKTTKRFVGRGSDAACKQAGELEVLKTSVIAFDCTDESGLFKKKFELSTLNITTAAQ